MFKQLNALKYHFPKLRSKDTEVQHQFDYNQQIASAIQFSHLKQVGRQLVAMPICHIGIYNVLRKVIRTLACTG